MTQHRLLSSIASLSLFFFTGVAHSALVTYDQFTALYENPATVIDFSHLKDGTTYAQAGTQVGVNPLMYSFYGSNPELGSIAYGVRSEAWHDDFSIRTKARMSDANVRDGVYWYSSGIAGLPVDAYGSLGPVFDLIFNPGKQQAMAV